MVTTGSRKRVAPVPAQDLAEFFRVLGDPTRIEILRLLVGGQEVACTKLEQILPISKSTISYHIKALKSVGLIRVRKDGRYYHYTLQRDRLDALLPGIADVMSSS
ncbi:MAG: ArsR/SmtB family transcription factor [Acidimicrobiia bacterium]